MAGGRGGRGNGRGGRGGRGGNNGRRVVQVVSPQPGAKNKTGGAKTLDARFTAMNKRRAEQVQRGTTARYAATMAKRTGQSPKKFAVSTRTRRPNSDASTRDLKIELHVGSRRILPVETTLTPRDPP